MRFLLILAWTFFLFETSLQAQLRPDGATASFRGALPPKATTSLTAEQVKTLEGRLKLLTRELATVKKHPRSADAAIFLKAVRYAIDFQEWYGKKPEDDLKKATTLLDEAAKRIASLKKGKTPWLDGSGQKVLGFYSKIDDSPQPYGVEIPEGLVFGKGKAKVPMWIWLHGRGDTDTDIHFVYSRLNAKKPGQFQPKGTIVIHPFGRYCNGWKSAGETDVFEVRDDAIERFNIDADRIALAGFSMGGAGAWHIGAHFADQWACVHTGAGFVDVKRYQKLTAEKMPPWYEQKLWGVYDVPNYARNLLNVPLVCYSGEVDPQRDSAEYMSEVLAKEGLQTTHLIGPGMGHKYDPEVLKDVQSRVEQFVTTGRNSLPKKLSLQTRSLAYSRMHWLQITGMERQWEDARVDANWDESSNEIQITTSNVSSLTVDLPKTLEKPKVFVNGAETAVTTSTDNGTSWKWASSPDLTTSTLVKKPLLQGPIDDGLKSRFIVVLPDGKSDGTAADKWSRIESEHFLNRWQGLMRGDVITRSPREITVQEVKDCNIILWGTPATNSLLKKMLESKTLSDVIVWDDLLLKIGNQDADVSSSVPVFCYPNPFNPNRYIIVNSGLTFREAHDKTNSLQNPKLPDWALLDISQPPSLDAAGKVVAADFFDTHWQVIDRVKSATDRD
jgi:predicted esterase